MRSLAVNGKARLLHWRRVRNFAVPASMIETATARRLAGDWAGACAAARVDVDLDFRAVTRARGRAFAGVLRADLRRLAPDLLRWHLPRAAGDGLLRPGLTLSLARYADPGHELHLVVRTAPAWADAGQRISLALWDSTADDPGPHPRSRPDRRFRLDLHQHLWAADRVVDLRERCGIARGSGSSHETMTADEMGAGARAPETWTTEAWTAEARTAEAWMAEVPASHGYAVHRWRAEAEILRVADRYDGPVVVRLGGGRRLLLDEDGRGTRFTDARERTTGAVLPYAATCLPLDLELLHAGLIGVDDLHPLVAEALTDEASPGFAEPRATTNAETPPITVGFAGSRADQGARPGTRRHGETRPPGVSEGVRLVECCGRTHRLALTDGVFVPLDHSSEDLRREELLASLGGPPLPCLRVIASEARSPDRLDEIRARLDHGDHAGALAIVEALLGPGARLPDGPLLDAFTDATEARITHGLYRAGLTTRVPAWANARVPAWLRVAPHLRSARTGRTCRSSRDGRPHRAGRTGRAGRSGRVNGVRRACRAERADRAGRRGRHHRLPKWAVATS
ncbi:hypothetical protein QLQ12_01690 [Actinoplanes sp. NEAU-A12]|uniref:Uncharacterized protein n=1 Tax=Actinoplanes sandaracinus TaxID=3045177 RepID=A0ABT6WC94_9ACTN|nr:hypothetical protein [Actinoplanes sandaracinus]MDI6097321.1 hypothetical protein [Actinoplanes sandaracinus]